MIVKARHTDPILQTQNFNTVGRDLTHTDREREYHLGCSLSKYEVQELCEEEKAKAVGPKLSCDSYPCAVLLFHSGARTLTTMLNRTSNLAVLNC